MNHSGHLYRKAYSLVTKEKSFITSAPNLMPSYEPQWSLVEKSFIHWLARKQVLQHLFLTLWPIINHSGHFQIKGSFVSYKEKSFITLAPNLMPKHELQWSLVEKSSFIRNKGKKLYNIGPYLMPNYEPQWSLVEKKLIHQLQRKPIS